MLGFILASAFFLLIWKKKNTVAIAMLLQLSCVMTTVTVFEMHEHCYGYNVV